MDKEQRIEMLIANLSVHSASCFMNRAEKEIVDMEVAV